MSTGWLRTLAVTAVLTAACGSGDGTATGKTATPPSASAPSTRSLALVTLSGSNQLVVRDITDLAHATTLSILATTSQGFQFVSETELSYSDDSGLVRTPLSGSPIALVAAAAQSVIFAWSPDGNTAAYLAVRGSNETDRTMELHLVSGGNDRMVSSMPGLPGVWGCETQACADSYDLHLAYSPDGRYISWAQNLTAVFRLWSAAGVDMTPATVTPNMTVWSDAGLYFVDSNGVEVYRNGVVSQFLPGVTWIRPKGSPGGGQIVYEARDSAGWAHTYVVNTSSGKVRELGKARSEPVFLTSRYVWYRGEQSCVDVAQCDPSLPIPSGKTYIYDLQDGTETESIITGVLDVWPHAA